MIVWFFMFTLIGLIIACVEGGGLLVIVLGLAVVCGVLALGEALE
ncbi:MAG: hypothetical protein ABSE62_00435 [Chthoniobacteraceae bacterium]|jgi:hypothetical protein